MAQRKSSRKPSHDIAIVGMAVNLQGAATLEDFWDNLSNGVESLSRLDPAALKAAGNRPEVMGRETYLPAAGLLDGDDMFDAEVFGFTPKEAAILDPEHRKFLETAWEALENAGYTTEAFEGKVGVFAGCGAGRHPHDNLFPNPDLAGDLDPSQRPGTGNDREILSTRVSRVFNLKGPSVTIQTGCSTALVGIHQAARALADGECDMALAGGVSVERPRGRGYLYRETAMLSPDGHCRAFDHKAGGTVIGSGVGAVVLRRLDDALAEGDHIWAVIKGTAIDTGGADKAGVWAASEIGHAQVVGQALDAAGVAPETIGYVECHGAGTLLGDPLEVAGLTQAFSARGAESTQVCAIGSVQTNLGNLDTAAAVTGLVKTALALTHAEIPPSLNYEAPNPMIDFAASPFHVNAERAAWPDGDTPRRAAVNTLGAGGDNAHAVLEQAPARAASDVGLFPFQPLVLSARCETALDEMSARLAAHLRAHPEHPLADVAFTLMQGRKRFDKRRVLVARDHAEAACLLETGDTTRVFTHDGLGATPDAVFMFPGKPQIAPGALRDLDETEPVFNTWYARGLDALGALVGNDIRAVLLDESTSDRLADPAITEPLGLVVSVATAQLVLSWGVVPAALTGVCAGELAAAVVAGVIGFEDAVRLAHLQGRFAAEKDPDKRRALRTELRGFASGIDLKAPGLALFSARTGAALTPAQATSPETWINTSADESRLPEALTTLAARPDRAFLTLGHDPGFCARVLGPEGISPERLVDTLTAPQSPVAGDIHFIGALSRLWALGVGVDWGQFWAGAERHRVPLPGYSFQRTRYPVEPSEAPTADREDAAHALARKDDMADWGWHQTWTPASAACEVDVATALDRAPKQTWLVFEDTRGIAKAAFDRLEAAGHRVVRVAYGDTFCEVGERRYTLLSEQGREGYEALFTALAAKGLTPTRIAHFWGLLGEEDFRLGSDPFHDNMEYGFYSLTYLAQALGRGNLRGPVHILAVTRESASVNGGPINCPEKATIAGPAGVMPRELPGVTCATLDLEPPSPQPARRGPFGKRAKRQSDSLTLLLLEDLLAEPSNEVAAYRDRRRYRQGYTRVRLDAPETPTLRKSGTYLITGGLGELGRDIARGLIEHHAATVILVARHALPPRDTWKATLARSAPGDRTAAAIRGVQELEALGGKVEIATANVTNLEAMRAVVTAAQKRHGRIDGILHAAGVFENGPILDRDPQAMDRVLAPKIEGVRVLDTLFPDGVTDLIVLFSSTTTATSNAGEVDLVAANAYLDAYAMSRQGGQTRVLSVGWGAWSEIGMVARALDRVDPSKLPPTRISAPLIDRAAFDPDGARLLRTTWEGGRAWVLDEHRIGSGPAAGTGLMPAAAIIELAAEGFTVDGGTLPFEIHDLTLERPFLAEAKPPRSALRMREIGARVQVEMQSDVTVDGRPARLTHARACVAGLEDTSQPKVELGAVALRCQNGKPRAAGEDGHLGAPQEARLSYGPAWHGLREMVLGASEGLARLQLPKTAAHTLAPGMILHPGLLDLAMTWAIELAPNHVGGTLWLAESCGSVRVHRPTGAEVACWVRHLEDDGPLDRASFEITLCDLLGNVLVEIGDLRMKRVDTDTGLTAVPLTAAEVTFPQPAAPPLKRSAAEAYLAWTARQGIRPGEGLGALERSIALGVPQVYVTPLDLDGLMAEALPVREWAARIDGSVSPERVAGAGAQERSAFTHIVPLNRSAQPRATPLFLVAGMFGDVLNLRHIAQILGEDRPVYGLQAKGLLGDDEPFHTFEEAAASMLAEMREVQPEGPYVVGGYSGGGIAALEIARGLEAEGGKAALVVLFDTFKDHAPRLERIDKAPVKRAEFPRKGPRHALEWARNRAIGKLHKRRGGEGEPEGAFHSHRIEMALRDAIAAYEPPPYDMNVVLMRPALDKVNQVSRDQHVTAENRNMSHDNGWGAHIPKLEVVEVPGDHASMVLAPNVGVLGTYLRTRIDAALASPGEIVQWDAPEAAE